MTAQMSAVSLEHFLSPPPTTLCMKHVQWMCCWDVKGVLNTGRRLCRVCGFACVFFLSSGLHTCKKPQSIRGMSRGRVHVRHWNDLVIMSIKISLISHIQNKEKRLVAQFSLSHRIVNTIHIWSIWWSYSFIMVRQLNMCLVTGGMYCCCESWLWLLE